MSVVWEPRQYGIGTKSQAAKTKLTIVLLICFIWMVVEIIYGIQANSLVNMTYAVDLLKEQVEFIINIICINFAAKQSNLKHTFGYLKVEILGAFCSIILMWILYTILLIESIITIVEGGKNIEQSIMAKLAVVSLILNIIKTAILASDEIGSDKKKDV